VIVCSGGNAEPGTVAEIAAGIDHDRTMRQDWRHEP